MNLTLKIKKCRFIICTTAWKQKDISESILPVKTFWTCKRYTGMEATEKNPNINRL